jgi:hypothetical protein
MAYLCSLDWPQLLRLNVLFDRWATTTIHDLLHNAPKLLACTIDLYHSEQDAIDIVRAMQTMHHPAMQSLVLHGTKSIVAPQNKIELAKLAIAFPNAIIRIQATSFTIKGVHLQNLDDKCFITGY